MAAELSWAEVSNHNTAKSLWVVVHSKVYNLTDFIAQVSTAIDKYASNRHSLSLFLQHPGGKDVLLEVGGKSMSVHADLRLRATVCSLIIHELS